MVDDLEVEQTLEDTPFYARSVLRSSAASGAIMHESLDLDRFKSAWVRALLPFRMPRIA
jgi:carotenoid 1,2-hydratase